MRIVGWGGLPGTGKTTLMRALMKRLIGPSVSLHTGLVHTHQFLEAKAIILGKYEEMTAFGGTDKLSMAVQPELERWLQERPISTDITIYFEGDRLFNNSFLSTCAELTNFCSFMILLTGQDELAKRRLARGDEQSASWILGRETKLANIINSRRDVRLINHEIPADTERILDRLLGKKGV
jgi:hypothetical protein